jgi:AcrR family transcriptional regulator
MRILTTTTEIAGPHRGEAREQAILDAALDLIGEMGYDRMSMDALAARAQASKATIYRRWPGKAQVVAEAIRRRACHDVTIPPDTGSMRGDLLAALAVKCDTMSGEDGPLLIGLLMAARTDTELAEVLHAQIRDGSGPLLAELFGRAVARGELPGDPDPTLVRELVPALILQRLIFGDDHLSDDAFISHVVDDFVLPLLAAGRRQAASAGT